MKKRTSFIMAGICLAFMLAGCGQKEMPQTDKGSGQILLVSPEPTVKVENEMQKQQESPAEPTSQTDTAEPLWAQDKMELYPGMEVVGVFDASREIIRLSIEQGDGVVKLFVDGEEKLSVPEDCEFCLRDILKQDACLELLVGDSASIVSGYRGEEEEGFMVTAYRLHPREIAPVPLLPCGEDASFFVGKSDWEEYRIHNWYFGAGFFAYIYDSAQEKWVQNQYRMMPEGYFLAKRSSLAQINVDGTLLTLPEEDVKIDARTGVGIAFEGTGAAAGTTYYNVYRTEDCGQNWSLVTEDFYAASASMEYIYVLDENTILCRFCPDGPWIGNSAYVTLDGGRTWEYIQDTEETKKYSFLFGEYLDE